MKNLFKISLFAMGVVFSSVTFAATGTGHAQAELTNPLTVVNSATVLFGTIAIDPAAGAQTVAIHAITSVVTCPATYVCSGSTSRGMIQITGAPSETVNVDLTGSTATLDDGLGNILTFDPNIGNSALESTPSGLGPGAVTNINIGGTIDFDGTEIAGTYTSVNGTGYQVTVNY